MPYLKLTTNTRINDTAELLKQCSQLVAKQTGKPESYVMVEIHGEQALLFAGSNQPAAYLECKSIGLTGTQTQSLAATLCQLLQANLQIDPARVYIEFSNCPANLWGWNGSTFG